jgi:tetratricopeptide (TPR) repeat protein
LLALLAGCGATPSRESSSVATGVAAGEQGGAAGPNTAPVPERAAAQYAEALELMKAGKTGDAELEFKQLTLAYPDYAGPALNLGLLYLQSARLAEAQAAFSGVLEHSPGNAVAAQAVAANELGITDRKLGKFNAAEAAYLKALAVEPDYAAAHLNLGVLYDLYLGEPQKALEQFERYVAIAGDNKQVAGWVAELHKRVGATVAAKKDAS